eukprot:750470-Hanusia_phi.AAC.1
MHTQTSGGRCICKQTQGFLPLHHFACQGNEETGQDRSRCPGNDKGLFYFRHTVIYCASVNYNDKIPAIFESGARSKNSTPFIWQSGSPGAAGYNI